MLSDTNLEIVEIPPEETEEISESKSEVLFGSQAILTDDENKFQESLKNEVKLKSVHYHLKMKKEI